ncbi:MAG TPA: hypothetical protein P5081_05915 [Phycisphaerae bacterium]|nr:hypothetical protein [Phycisphaerae bacterium]HRW52403.1 hypothetical protein [Phycisphaerae bacterium]
MTPTRRYPRFRKGHSILLVAILFVSMGQIGNCECSILQLLERADQETQVETTGSCCNLENVCTDGVFASDCERPNIFEPNGTCAEGGCDRAPFGACCLNRGGCELVATEDSCDGMFLGRVPCPDCESGGGGQDGPGGPETPDADSRTCCLGDGRCLIVTVDGCASFGGTLQPLGVSCDDADCSENVSDESGCCLPDGNECVSRTQADCEAEGGVFQTQLCADIVDCGLVVEGACCDGASCSVISRFTCETLGRTFKGGATDCGSTPCP